jgi:hypothetical protein
MATPVPVLVLTGAVGVGKTIVGEEVSCQLQVDGVPHLYVDLDGLAKTYPRSAADPLGLEIIRQNLTSVWHNSHDRGSTHAVLAGLFENAQQLEILPRAIPGAELTVVQVSAPDTQIAERLTKREVGLGRNWSLLESIELDTRIFDAQFADVMIVHDELQLEAVAAEVVHLWNTRSADRAAERDSGYGSPAPSL